MLSEGGQIQIEFIMSWSCVWQRAVVLCCLLYRAEIWLHHGYTSSRQSSRYIAVAINAE